MNNNLSGDRKCKRCSGPHTRCGLYNQPGSSKRSGAPGVHSIIIHMPEKEGFRFWLRGGNPQPFEHSMQNNGSTSAVQESLEDTVRVPKAGILKYKDQVHNVSQGMFLIGQFIVSKYPYLFFPLLGAEEEQPSSVQETPEPTGEIVEDDILKSKDPVHNVGQGMFLIGQLVVSNFLISFSPFQAQRRSNRAASRRLPRSRSRCPRQASSSTRTRSTTLAKVCF